MPDARPLTDTSPEQAAEELIPHHGLPTAIRWATALLQIVVERAAAARAELDDAISGTLAPAKATRAAPASPKPPATREELIERVREALAAKPRSLRGLIIFTGASPLEVGAALESIGATKHGLKYSLPPQRAS